VPPTRLMLDMIDRHVEGYRAAVATYMALALAAGALVVIAGMTLLALLVDAADGALRRADEAVLHALAGHRPVGWQEFALDVTALGNTLTLAVLLAWAAAGFWIAGRRLAAVLLAVGFASGRLLTEILKAMFNRPRPEILEWGTHVASASFPSAHAMSAAVAYGSLAYLVARFSARPTVRVAIWTFATVLVTAIAASRVYLGVHYVADVIAGMLAGALWTALVLSTLSASRRLASTRPAARRLRQG
jgi:undecaprenyl-diphosphatase